MRVKGGMGKRDVLCVIYGRTQVDMQRINIGYFHGIM